MVGEFLDHEWYQERPAPVAPARDGWRVGRWADQTVTIPTTLVRLLAQPDRLVHVSLNERSIVETLVGSLGDRGFDEPATIVVDKHGRMILKDGHHRLLAAEQLGLGRMPVRFLEGRRIGLPVAQPVVAMLPALLLAAER